MKYLTFLLLLLLPVMLLGQSYSEYTVKQLYDNQGATLTVDLDSIYDTGASYYSIWTATAAADSAQSQGVPNQRGGNDITIHFGADSISGTTSIEGFFGIYRGIEAGWLWNSMGSISSDDSTITWHVGNQSWSSYYVIGSWGIKVKETGNQRNGIWVRVEKFNWR
jgi:hypothetical protein